MSTKWLPGARSTNLARLLWLRETQRQLPRVPATYLDYLRTAKNAVPKTWNLDVFGGRRYSTNVDESLHSYSTTFPTTENPVSEGGIWQNAGGAVAQYWKPLRVSGGRLHATQSTLEYEDNVAIVNPSEIPFGGNHVIRGGIHITGGYTAPDFTHEIQLLLRGAFGDDHIEGYEILLQLGSSKPVIVKWYGSGGGGFFAILGNTSESELGFQHGDICIAQISGTSPALIEVFRDRAGTVLPWATASDNGTVLSGAPILTDGQPGAVCFCRPDAGLQLDGFGWDSWSASDDPDDFV